MTWWTVQDSPVVQIGAIDGAEAVVLDQVRGAARLSDGRIAVATRTDVRFFDADGSHVLTAGRVGVGPGEFREIASLLRAGGDTLWAFDYGLQRVTVLEPQDAYAHDLTIVAPVRRAGEAVGRYPDGAMLVHVTPIQRRPEGVINRVPTLYGVVIPGTRLNDTIGTFHIAMISSRSTTATAMQARPHTAERPPPRITRRTSTSGRRTCPRSGSTPGRGSSRG